MPPNNVRTEVTNRFNRRKTEILVELPDAADKAIALEIAATLALAEILESFQRNQDAHFRRVITDGPTPPPPGGSTP